MSTTPGNFNNANSIPDEYYFITSPQDVSWDKNSKSSEIATYGTNAPYLSYGSTSLRKLKLGNAMLEGFSNGKEIEGNVTQLESCMEMVIDSGSGFTSPYCWHVFAGDKSYGTFIITSVSVDEKMRDMTGKATRAFVDVALQEVSSLQVSSGTDITSAPVINGITQSAYDALNPVTETASQEARVRGSQTPNRAVAPTRPGTVPNPGTPPASTNNQTPRPGGLTQQQQNEARYNEAVRSGARF